MLLTIIVVWAIAIPSVVLAFSLRVAEVRETERPETASWSTSEPGREASRASAVPRCAAPAARPRRTTTRRVCPEQARGVGRRPASA
jgi:hypothetical protein